MKRLSSQALSAYVARIRREERALQVGVRALPSVWSPDSAGLVLDWARRILAGLRTH